MDFTPTEEQAAVGGLATDLFATATHPGLGVEGFDTDLWARLVEGGLLGLSVREELGGGGLPLAVSAVVAEAAGKAAGRVPVVPVLTALPLLEDADLVGRVLAGDAIVVPALQADGWTGGVTATDGRLSGTQLAVAWAPEASHVVAAASGSLYLVAVEDVTLEPVKVSSLEPTATITFDGSLGAPLSAGVAEAVARHTLLTCSYGVGVAEASLLLAAHHVSTREQFGKPLAAFQTITYQVADCYIAVEAMRLTAAQAVWRLDQGLDAAEQTAIAAYWGSDGIQHVVSKAVHLHGGLGVDVSYPLHKWFLIGKVLELSLGGAQRTLEELGALLAAR
ncbi:MAG: putative acyl-CoA dehydrogenase [Frankiales bacterium]|nr:putative acyl-CoA dehydrogenase [Frankiales bacterium]